MKTILNWLLLLALTLISAMSVQANEPPPVAGVMGLQMEEENGWLAVRVEVLNDHALAGILWYNNDSTLPFPEISVGIGHANGPGVLADMVTVAETVYGSASDWSNVTFTQPIGASEGALYVVFRFPVDQFDAEGEGGGPAVGYCEIASDRQGWISGDGEFWMMLRPDYSFAVLPQFIPFEEGMLVKSLGGGDAGDSVPVVRPYLTAGPNPFNPMTEFRFGLTQASEVVVDVYNLSGARVARILQTTLGAGHHSVHWTGVDQVGRRVASGPYFARLRAGKVTLTQRVMLVK